MGRYQFVGKTLRQVAKDMNLPEDTVFTPDVQDAMFLFLARQVTQGKSDAGKRKALRDTWEGFSRASDAQLNQMVAEIESGSPDLGGGPLVNQNVPPSTSLRPKQRPEGGADFDTGTPLTEAVLAPSSEGGSSTDPIGNVTPRPSDERLAQAWDILYGSTHDPETGQLIKGE